MNTKHFQCMFMNSKHCAVVFNDASVCLLTSDATSHYIFHAGKSARQCFEVTSVLTVLSHLEVFTSVIHRLGTPAAAHKYQHHYLNRKSVLPDAGTSLTTAGPLELHLLHVDLTGRHPDGNRVDNGCILKARQMHQESSKMHL